MPGLHVLPQPVDLIDHWLKLVRRHPVKGADVFDLQLIATMLAAGVRRVYTFNINDFNWNDEIDVVLPT